MPSWTTMRNLATGDLVTETDMDAIRGNIEYLLAPNADSIILTDAGTISTTSSSWIDIHEDLSITITTNGGPVLVGLSLAYYGANSTTDRASFDIEVDGTRVSGASYGLTAQVADGTHYQYAETVTLVVLLTSLAAGSHTITPQCQANYGTCYINANSNSSALQCFAIEL